MLIELDRKQAAPKLRSETIILVKNLRRIDGRRHGEDEERGLFSPFGDLGQFRRMPLYLEWAPVNAQNGTERSAVRWNMLRIEFDGWFIYLIILAGKADESAIKAFKKENPIDEVHEEPEPNTTLFVKNLNFSTTDEILRSHFDQCGKIFTATVAKKKDPKNPGQVLSMGYGFIQFFEKNSANQALKTLQNSQLDGHNIELKVLIKINWTVSFIN